MSNAKTLQHWHSQSTGAERFMRLGEVVKVTGFSRSQIYRLMNRGDFPRAIPLGPCAVAWLQSQVDEWIREKIEHAMRSANASPSVSKGTE